MSGQESKEQEFGSKQEPKDSPDYSEPVVEKRLTADELQRQAQYAGVPTADA